MSDPLRSKLIRLAHAKPELRQHLLPILAKTATESGSDFFEIALKQVRNPNEAKLLKIGQKLLPKSFLDDHRQLSRLVVASDKAQEFVKRNHKRKDWSTDEANGVFQDTLSREFHGIALTLSAVLSVQVPYTEAAKAIKTTFLAIQKVSDQDTKTDMDRSYLDAFRERHP